MKFYLKIAGAIVLSGLLLIAPAEAAARWDWRVIPLPQELDVSGSITAAVDNIVLLPCAEHAPPVATARSVLREFALGTNPAAAVRIALHQVNVHDPAPARPPISCLADLPNRDQAYAITCMPGNGAVEISLTALTPAGLLYAARTLRQLVMPPGATNVGLTVEIPLATILDWPDIEERGFWGNLAADPAFLQWMGEYKLNLAEIGANGAGCKYLVDAGGAARVDYDLRLFDLAVSNAIAPVPHIAHFDSYSFGGDSGLYEKYPAARGQAADPKAKPPPDLDDPDLRRIYTDWMKAMAAIPGARKIDAWLSEGAHFDTNTLARHPGTPGHVLETRLMLEAWAAARSVNSNLMLRVMLSQGSFDHYPAILAAIPPEVGVLYYHGSWRPVCPGTYSQTREKIIIPVLEQYAAAGGWLGVVPTLANLSINSFWSCPQFVRYRTDEFSAKHLRNITAFATPNLAVRDMNFTALAEWAWNADGRSPREFARAWAFRKGFKQPDLVADWVAALGPVNWDLAASGVPGARLERASDRIQQRPAELFGAALFREIRDMAHVAENLDRCARARLLAEKIGDAAIMAETMYAQGYMQIIHELGLLNSLPADPAVFSEAQKETANASLRRLALAAMQITDAAQKERRLLFDAEAPMSGRWLDPLIEAERLAAVTIREFADVAAGSDRLLADLWQPAVQWTSALFSEKPEVTAEWDVTESIRGAGKYIFLFRAQAGPPVYIKGARLIAEDAGGQREIVSADIHAGHTFAWHTKNPFYALDLPEVAPDRKYLLTADLTGAVPRSESVLENSKGTIFMKKSSGGM